MTNRRPDRRIRTNGQNGSLRRMRLATKLLCLCWAIFVSQCNPFGVCFCQEKTAAFPETRRGFIAEFDSPKDQDPFIPPLEPVITFSPELLPLWLVALDRDEADLKRLVAETIAAARREGWHEVDGAAAPLIRQFGSESNDRMTREAIASTLVQLDARQAADVFFDRVKSAGLPLATIIEPALARWQDSRMEDIWLARLSNEHSNSPRQYLAIQCLGLIKSRTAVEPLLKLAGSPLTAATFRMIAAEALSEIGDEANVALAEKLYGAERAKRIDRIIAAKILRGQTGQSATALLSNLAQDSQTSVSAIAAQNLFEIDPMLVRPLAVELAASPNANVRMVAGQAFAYESNESDVRALIAMLADAHPALRAAARQALSTRSRSGEFVELIDTSLIAIVKDADSNADWRQLEQAIRYLAEFDRKQAAPLLVRHLRSSRDQVFLPAAWALRKLSVAETFGQCLDYVDEFKSAQDLAKVENDYRDAQISQLCQMFGINHYEPAIDTLKSYVPKEVMNRGTQSRASAIWSLGHIYEDRPQEELAAALVVRLNDVGSIPSEVTLVRAASAVTVARMGNAEQLPELRKNAKENGFSGEVGYSCAWGIKRLTDEPIPVSKPVIISEQGWFLYPYGKQP